LRFPIKVREIRLDLRVYFVFFKNQKASGCRLFYQWLIIGFGITSNIIKAFDSFKKKPGSIGYSNFRNPTPSEIYFTPSK
jgi:hypothetical protein